MADYVRFTEDYEKHHYDVLLSDGRVIKQCWPNAGKMCAPYGDYYWLPEDNIFVRQWTEKDMERYWNQGSSERRQERRECLAIIKELVRTGDKEAPRLRGQDKILKNESKKCFRKSCDEPRGRRGLYCSAECHKLDSK